MKKTTLLLSVLIASTVLFLASCQQSGSSEFPGYSVTESGLIYKIQDKSSDTAVPRIGDFLDLVMTYGTDDSVLFDSRTLPTKQQMQVPMVASVHQGDIYEGFALLHQGDSATFIVNADSVWQKLFRMPSAPPELDSVKYIHFEIRLNEVISAEDLERRKKEEMELATQNELTDRAAYLAANYPDAQPTESGMYYIQIKKGKGKNPVKGETVKVNYAGTLLDGTVFDTSIEDVAQEAGIYNANRPYEPFEFPLGQGRVIRGWDEGIGMMKKGEKGLLIIPSDLGYGPRGSGSVIGPYSTLVFEVELIDIIKK